VTRMPVLVTAGVRAQCYHRPCSKLDGQQQHPMNATATTFAQVLDSLRRDGDHVFTVRVPDDWRQGRTVFGGMQVALAVRAMRGVMIADRGLPLRSLQATFVGPLPANAEVRLRAEQLRVGRAATHARCDLLHDGEVVCTTVAIFGAARPSQVSLDIPRPGVGVDPESLQDLPAAPEVTPAFLGHFGLRWVSGAPPYSGSRDPHTAIFVKLRDHDCTPEDALIALADSVPPPALSMLSTPAPASSLNWTLELLGDPGELARDDWALIGTEVRAGIDGYLSQTSVLWGPRGHAFSLSHQTVALFG
jgi:acyl-CoA thioesterase